MVTDFSAENVYELYVFSVCTTLSVANNITEQRRELPILKFRYRKARSKWREKKQLTAGIRLDPVSVG